MAEIRSFHALRYDSEATPLELVLTQPYDKISPRMQAEYYERSPHNLVRYELGHSKPHDNDAENVYTRARDFLRDLQKKGVLRRDAASSIYAYRQRFKNPNRPTEHHERAGFIALGRLHEYDEHIVYPHERTLTGPKEDRFRLLSTTRTHSGQIFMLYDDPAQKVDQLLAAIAASREEDAFVVDEYGVENRIWQVNEPSLISQVQEHMRDQRLIIADGHHRYETSLKYRRTSGVDPNSDAPENFTMMTFVNMAAPGLMILPTHRVLTNSGFDEGTALERLQEYFTLLPRTAASVEPILAELAEAGRDNTAIAMVTSRGCYLLKAKPEAVNKALHSLTPLERKLDVAVLHKLIFGKLMQISEKATADQKHLAYHRSAQAAVDDVHAGAEAAFLLNPVPISLMRDLTFEGTVMPQKSTDFFPKLLSGLTLYALDAQTASAGTKS
ncbi:MAG TPA: DUF1015 domain-containing protein [Terriglobales bacterium]